MATAGKCVQGGLGLREASRLYKVPVEALRRWAIGLLSLDCRSGSPTALTPEEEKRLHKYVVK